MSDTLIKNGHVVTASGTRRADIEIRGEQIVRVGPDLPETAGQVIDATDLLVLPGIVDVHTHPVYLDDLRSLPITAAHGGVTTVIHFAYAKPGHGLLDTVHQYREEGEASSILDFALHGTLFDPKNQAEEIPDTTAIGVTSYKMFMAYAKLGWMTDDYQLMRTLDIISRCHGMGMVHAENGLAIDYLEDRMLQADLDAKENFLDTRPALLEAESTHRAIAMAQVAGCPLYIVHVTSALGLEVIARARTAGSRVYGETCPHYLTLTNDDLLARGPLLKIGPPLREAGDRDALWKALASGLLDTVASDHAAKDKHLDDDFFSAPFGAPQVETMLRLVYSDGVHGGRLPLERLVRVMCENPAKIYGLYPRKGTIQPGSDADLVLFDPAAEETITHAAQHSNAPYTAYEGRSCIGRPVLTMQRGRVLVERGEVTCPDGCGRFLPTDAGKVPLQQLQ